MRLLTVFLGSMFLFQHAAAQNFTLSCNNQEGKETILLKQAPHGAIRISKETLEVKFTGGTKRFINTGPDSEQGVHWLYCGYDKKTKTHLISKLDDARFTGVILFEKTGNLIDAGHTVAISPDGKSLLTIEQQDGVDGETWSLENISGKRLWTGYAGVTQKIGQDTYDSIYAEFKRPRWINDSVLSADFVCADKSESIKGVVTLKHVGGEWKWLPDYKCSK